MSQSISRGRIYAIIAGAVVIGVAGSVVFAMRKRLFGDGKPDPTKATHFQAGLSRTDATVTDVERLFDDVAHRWQPNAVRWSITVRGIEPDGTLDFTEDGRAKATYVLPSRLSSKSPRVRRDAIKVMKIGPRGVEVPESYAADKRWTKMDTTPPPEPECDLAELVASLELPAGATARVSHDPKFARGPGAPEAPSWRVNDAGEGVDGWYAFADCARTK